MSDETDSKADVTTEPKTEPSESSDISKDKDREKAKSKKRSRSRDRRDRDRARDKGKDKDKDRRDRDRRDSDRKRSRRSRSRSRSRGRRRKSRSRSRGRRRRSRSRSKSAEKPVKKKRTKSAWDQAPDPNALAALQQNAVAQTMNMLQLAGLPVHDPETAQKVAQALLPGRPVVGMAMQDVTKLKQLTVHSRRIYVGNIMPHVTDDTLRQFLDNAIMNVPGRPPQPNMPIFTVTINHGKMFAFIEFHCIEDCDIAICMDGIVMDGVPLKIRRPKDYQRPTGLAEPKKYHIPGIISTNVDNDHNKIFLGNLPTTLSDDEVKEFVSTFGQLKAFSLVKDIETGESKGYAFFAYVDPAVTEAACKGLDGIMLGGKEVSCQRGQTMPGATQELVPTGANTINIDSIPAVAAVGKVLEAQAPSAIVAMYNLATLAELQENRHEILQDVSSEVSKFGPIQELSCQGEVIVIGYQAVECGEQAREWLQGRRFAGRTVLTTYMTKEEFADLKLEVEASISSNGICDNTPTETPTPAEIPMGTRASTGAKMETLD